jgi:hypothetical protein
MRSSKRVALLVCVLALVVPISMAADFEPDPDGPWISVDVIDLVDYGNAAYYDYLGQGYIAILDVLKSEGLVLDYGVMEKTTGDQLAGNVVIWWSVKSLADYEKAGERFETLLAELKTPEEWGELWSKLEKVRKIRSSNLYRAVLWNKIED